MSDPTTPTFAHWPKPVSTRERRARGKEARAALPLEDLADVIDLDRPRDPLKLLEEQDAQRIPWLVPVRYGRMLRDPFVFFRGNAAVMAHDLAGLPHSNLQVQLCGDAHLLNFGVFGTPERQLVFDLNDFDETLPGPFEWDTKRLVASMVLAARSLGLKEKRQRAIAETTAWRYRDAMAAFAEGDPLANWYARTDIERLLATIDDAKVRSFAADVADRARAKDHLQAAARLTEVVGGRRRIIPNPPLVVPLEDFPDSLIANDPEGFVHAGFEDYVPTLRDDVRVLIDRYTYVDAALKVVGVGSVGTRCAIVLMQGTHEQDLLLLQAKQAGPSVLEEFLGPSAYAHPGERVVAGQRLMQSASDIFLGWSSGALGTQFYWRQLRDWKGAVDISKMNAELLLLYGRLCAATLAKAHARSGDPVAIASYLGKSTRFETALAEYGIGYADLAERDFAALREAVDDGRIEARDDESLARR